MGIASIIFIEADASKNLFYMKYKLSFIKWILNVINIVTSITIKYVITHVNLSCLLEDCVTVWITIQYNEKNITLFYTVNSAFIGILFGINYSCVYLFHWLVHVCIYTSMFLLRISYVMGYHNRKHKIYMMYELVTCSLLRVL